MADTKISGLPAASTPLAGTEVLPIVQGGITEQVSVDNLTAGKAVSALSITFTNGAASAYTYAAAAPFSSYRADGTISVPTATATGANIGGISGFSYDGTAYRQVGSIRFLTNGATSSTNYGADITFLTGNPGAATITTKMRLNGYGVLGVGATPAAWTIGGVTEMPTGGFVSFAGNGNIVSNAYYDGAYKYTTTAAAAIYQQSSGTHEWLYAASGTAGTSFTFTSGMKLDNAGFLGVGTASPQANLHVSGDVIMQNGVYFEMTAPASINAAATLTGAQVVQGYVNYTGAAANLTLPTATNLQAAMPTGVATLNDIAFDFTIINTGSGTATLVVNTGITAVGALTTASGTATTFHIRKTATNTFIVYRT